MCISRRISVSRARRRSRIFGLPAAFLAGGFLGEDFGAGLAADFLAVFFAGFFSGFFSDFLAGFFTASSSWRLNTQCVPSASGAQYL
jgi:hypothetical protein